tara:strand:+ start:163 stop:342 length:180 start_codon:yes stop_codon:yes gene_type:complete
MNEKIILPPAIDFRKISNKINKNEKKVNYFNPHDVVSNNISLPRILKKENEIHINTTSK